MSAHIPVSILLVGDDVTALLPLEVLVEDLCEHIVLASSLEEALQKIQTTQFAAIVLAREMSADKVLEAGRRIREISATLPLIFMVSSDAGDFPAREVYLLGAVDHVEQPVIPEVLRAKLSFSIDFSRNLIHAARLEQEQNAAAQHARNRPTTEFLAKLAHELRNPLAPIRSGLGILRLGGDNPSVVANIREMMERQVAQMVHLIDGLLDATRLNFGEMRLKKERVELRAIVASAVEESSPAIKAADHGLTVNVPDEAIYIDVDSARIIQVLVHLLSNAAKFTQSGGEIALMARSDGQSAVISVTDNGVGIPKESLHTLFDMFKQERRKVQRAQGGLGLGLSFVRQLVQMHGGTVTAQSAGAGMGATFTVRLPLASADGLPANVKVGAHGVPNDALLKRFRLLVVDDNLDAADSLSDLLELDGHTIRVAYNGAEAVSLARDFQPEVAIVDIGMPGMNGYEVAKALRAIPGLEQITLVALTGWGTERARDQARQAGFDHHLTKPMELAAIDLLLSKLNSPAN